MGGPLSVSDHCGCRIWQTDATHSHLTSMEPSKVNSQDFSATADITEVLQREHIVNRDQDSFPESSVIKGFKKNIKLIYMTDTQSVCKRTSAKEFALKHSSLQKPTASAHQRIATN